MKKETLTTAVRARLAKISNALKALTDETALDTIDLFPAWRVGEAYAVGDRVQYGGQLYRVVQAHTSQADWTPDIVPALFAPILPGQDGTEPGEWVQPDSTNPYKKGDRVIFDGHVYESLIDGNVWSPSAYPAGWQLVD
jgi:hypothetical protein